MGDVAAMRAAAEKIGYPVLVKPAAGGGGIGMLPAHNADELPGVVERASSLAARSFSHGDVYLERSVERPRHNDVQVLGDRTGGYCNLFVRYCCFQRRTQ